MKKRMRWAIALAGILCAAGGGARPAQGQTLLPVTTPGSPAHVTAGNTLTLTVTDLTVPPAPDPNFIETVLAITAEDYTRLACTNSAVQQIDPYTTNYYDHIWFPVAAIQRVAGLFDPIGVVVLATRAPEFGIYWAGTCYLTVDDPIFTFNPGAPALRIGDTLPVALHREALKCNANLPFRVRTGDPSIMTVGTNAFSPGTNQEIEVEFGLFEPVKTIYLSGLALNQDVAYTNIVLTAQVGSYLTNLQVLVTPNAGLVLAPADPQVAAGDTLAMTVTRDSATNVSPLVVLLTSENPAVLSVPASVVIPAGARSVEFAVTGLKPGLATVFATAVGVPPGVNSRRSVEVVGPALSFLPNPLTNNIGVTAVLHIQRPYAEAGAELALKVESLDAGVCVVSTNTVRIPAGYISADVYVLGVGGGATLLKISVGDYNTTVGVIIGSEPDIVDPDGDGLNARWEQYLGADPNNAFSLWEAGGGIGPQVNDGQYDSDADGLSNLEEINNYGTDALRGDTDGDGVPDGTEVAVDISHPLHPMSCRHYHERSLDLAGTHNLALPDTGRFAFGDSGWTAEYWIRPGADRTGDVLRVGVDGTNTGFRVGLDDLHPFAEIISGTNSMVVAGGTNLPYTANPLLGHIQRLPTGTWSHVACVWSPDRNSLEVYLNGVLLIAQESLATPSFSAGLSSLAPDLAAGQLDDVRVWNYDRNWEEVSYWHNRLFPAPAGYVRQAFSNFPLVLYYRFDEGGGEIVDYAHLNQAAYFLAAAPGSATTNTAVSLLGRDDEDGDLLPEWWTYLHNLEQYSIYVKEPESLGTFHPGQHLTDAQAAQIAYFRAFTSYGSIGNVVGYAQVPPDDMFYYPKDTVLGHDGRHVEFFKYIYLETVPKTAVLELFTPGMTTTVAYVNNQQVTAAGAENNTYQSILLASGLKVGRNLIYVKCMTQYTKYQDVERTRPGTFRIEGVCTECHYEKSMGKFDARLTCDGVQKIVRGDEYLFDPRAVWHGQTWSTTWEEMHGYLGRADQEDRHVPSNPDYGLPFDVDEDSLNAYYEYFGGNNPRDRDSNNNGVPDNLEDIDGDGLANGDEQKRGSHPLLPDTDDDGILDGLDASGDRDPASSLSPVASRAVICGGGSNDCIEFPIQKRFALESWTVEAWVQRDAAETNGGIVAQRLVGPNGANYEIGLGDGSSNTAPVNVPYLKYTAINGVTTLITNDAPLGTGWNHLAGVYDAARRQLRLYLNGTNAAVAEESLQAPAIYAGGPIIQRFGSGFMGRLDEVRIWNTARTQDELRNNSGRTVTMDAAGLAGYYRFDDDTSFRTNAPLVGTSANNGTNAEFAVLPWTWGQAQDYVRSFASDWWDKWSHAASLVGRVSFTTNGGGAIGNPPSLQVNIFPPEVAAAGAEWTIPGSLNWYASGYTLTDGLTTGDVAIIFRPLAGWLEPTNVTATLYNNQKTIVEQEYLRSGSLRVFLSPSDVLGASGAQWRVDGGAWANNGDIVTNLNPGLHVVEYKDVSGWIAPASTNVTILSGQTTTIIDAIYVHLTGTVQVYLAPAGVGSNGAAWRLDGGDPHASGELVSGLALGSYTVSFDAAPPWWAPSNVTVTLSSNSWIVLTGTYYQVTGVYVSLAPDEAVAAGAQWRANGGGWNNSGVTLPLATGEATLEFRPIPGWAQPASRTVAITSDVTTLVSAQYYPMETYGPPGSWVTLSLNQPRGLDFDSQRRLYIADRMDHRIVVFDTRDYTSTNWGGPSSGTGLGEFDQPFAVAVDDADNVYVADGNNNRVQKYNAATKTWQSWGGPLSGTAPGQFNVPFDVALDSAGNLYVADTYNHRIQKMTPGAVWSVVVSNGMIDGYARYPYGIEVDPSNNLFVADYPNGFSRVQMFTTNGVFLRRAGSSQPEEGSLGKPQTMCYTPDGTLFVADMTNNRVAWRTGTNVLQTLLGSGLLTLPEGVAWDERGYLYIADTGSNRIVRVQLTASENIPPTPSGFSFSDTGGKVLSWRGVAGWFYCVQYNDHFPSAGWLTLPGGDQLRGSNVTLQCEDTNGGLAATSRVYRILAF